MFYGDNVQDTRQLFYSSWQKYSQQQILTPLEQQLVDVILLHPEYHALLAAGMPEEERIYFPELGETNPFLHMGLHLALREQVATDRPPGIRAIYQQLLQNKKDISLVEHSLMEPLVDCIWQSQRSQTPPSDASYLKACRQLLSKT